jgi:hypothetical protein
MSLEPLFVSNRVVAIIVPKAPFVAWINAADPVPTTPAVTLADAQAEPSAFLIPTNEADDVDQPDKRWIQRCWKVLFEQMLEDWYTDPALWPRNLTIKMFREWCDIRIHSIVLDCGDTPIEYED